jgi:hypothetical protein
MTYQESPMSSPGPVRQSFRLSPLLWLSPLPGLSPWSGCVWLRGQPLLL